MLGTLTTSQHNILDSEKLTNMLVLLMGFEPWVTESLESNALPTESPPLRHLYQTSYCADYKDKGSWVQELNSVTILWLKCFDD